LGVIKIQDLSLPCRQHNVASELVLKKTEQRASLGGQAVYEKGWYFFVGVLPKVNASLSVVEASSCAVFDGLQGDD